MVLTDLHEELSHPLPAGTHTNNINLTLLCDQYTIFRYLQTLIIHQLPDMSISSVGRWSFESYILEPKYCETLSDLKA